MRFVNVFGMESSCRQVCMQPKIHISFSPENAGLVSALFYVESQADIFGWYATSSSRGFCAAFFMAENFYANGATVLHHSLYGDVYGPWIVDFPPTRSQGRCPLPETVQHELERIQFEFISEWLFFKSDSRIDDELVAYQEQDLPINTLNIKCKRLKRLIPQDGGWIYSTAGTDINVLEFLQKHLRFNRRGMI
ncbi:MAG: hypothetical protein A3K04_10000 [Gallionellales bacterium RBG_16_56_9]|nr:MAG: hypothetical protein A3K04_10000 [Gallionellales bacterium RBG_16_56_9]